MTRYPSMAEIERRDPARAARIRAYDRERGKRNRSDPIRSEKIRAHDRMREKARNRPRIAEIQKANPQRASEIRIRYMKKQRRYRADPAKRARNMFLSVRSEAKRKGVVFDLTEEWFVIRLVRGRCELSDLSFCFDDPRGPDRPSVDRLVAGGGYTLSNCRMVLYAVNSAIGYWGEDHICRVFEAIIERRGK